MGSINLRLIKGGIATSYFHSRALKLQIDFDINTFGQRYVLDCVKPFNGVVFLRDLIQIYVEKCYELYQEGHHP